MRLTNKNSVEFTCDQCGRVYAVEKAYVLKEVISGKLDKPHCNGHLLCPYCQEPVEYKQLTDFYNYEKKIWSK